MKELLYSTTSLTELIKWLTEEVNIGITKEHIEDIVKIGKFAFGVSVYMSTDKDFWKLTPTRSYCIEYSQYNGWKISAMVQ